MKTNTLVFFLTGLIVLVGLFLAVSMSPTNKARMAQAFYTPLPPTDTTPPYRPTPPPSNGDEGPSQPAKIGKIAFYYQDSDTNKAALDSLDKFEQTKQGQLVGADELNMSNPVTAFFHRHDLSKGAKMPAYLSKIKGEVVERLENGQALSVDDLQDLALRVFKVDKDGNLQAQKAKQ